MEDSQIELKIQSDTGKGSWDGINHIQLIETQGLTKVKYFTGSLFWPVFPEHLHQIIARSLTNGLFHCISFSSARESIAYLSM